ncbi:hypothetical protein NCCP2331_29810 [Sporosarcina sp. NCCP-2331]|nr:hypothetical protein NCCP2331_29810 [Sporosarcina sp. NCCP-2331]GLB57237.1 hypothetical protein NCCP2378_30250 [Sporosarcina sp. NCCP-2378]
MIIVCVQVIMRNVQVIIVPARMLIAAGCVIMRLSFALIALCRILHMKNNNCSIVDKLLTLSV